MSGDQKQKSSCVELFTEENNRAEALIAAGDLPAAAKLLVEIIELDPNNHRTYNNFGIIAWMRLAWEDAFGMFKKALEIKADYVDGLMNLFDAGLKLRRVSDVRPFFEQARAQCPHDEEIKIILESILREGEDIYRTERGLRIGTYDPEIEKAQKLLDEGKLNEAMTLFLKINDEKGPSAPVFSGLGIISFYQQRFYDAFSLFVQSIKLNPTSKENFLNLLDAAQACGKREAAIGLFEVYLKNFPFLKEISGDFEAAAKI
jgi:tetratricopeptide (TPR) repeat protein